MSLEVLMNNKEEIMEQALLLFASEGYESVGVARIVSQASVTKPTLYHYFGNKEGLLKSLYEYYFAKLIKSLKIASHYNQDVINTMETMTKAYIDFAKENLMFFVLSNHLRKGPLKSESHLIVKPFHDEELELITKLIYDISSHHSNLKGNEEFLVMNYMNLVNGFIEIHIRNNDLKKMDNQAVTKLTKQFLYGIFSL